MRDFRELVVWQKAHALTLKLYPRVMLFPNHELYGLISQIRRSASSIGANLAEGVGKSKADFARFAQISYGSSSELHYHLLLSKDLEYLKQAEYEVFQEQLVEVKKMLTGLIQHLNSRAAGAN
jgi:four helix bundle protein